MPSARPNRELAPSATTTQRARTVSVTPVSRRRIVAPVTRPPSTRGDDRLAGRPERRPGLHGPVRHHLVEVPAAHHVSVVRKVGVLGPAQLQGDAVGHRAQALVALETGELVGEPHLVELAHGPRGQAVAAGLLAGEALLVDDAAPGGPAARASTRRPHRPARHPRRARRTRALHPASSRSTAHRRHAGSTGRRTMRSGHASADARSDPRAGLRCVPAPSSVVEKHPTERLRGRSRGVRPGADGGPKGRCPTC